MDDFFMEDILTLDIINLQARFKNIYFQIYYVD